MRASLGFFLLLAVPAVAQTPADPAPRVGMASVVEQRAEASRDQTVRRLALRDALFRNERLSTGSEPGTKLHVRLLDQTVITLGPNSEVVLDDFAINPAANTAEVSLKLSRGLLRFVGGKHADTGTRYQVRTPVATIGVRGTAFDVKVDEGGETTVQLTEGEVSFENEDGLEVILDEPLETSSLDEEDDAPSEPEVDEALAEEFDDLDLSEEELAYDSELAEAIEEEEIEAIDGEDPDVDAEDQAATADGDTSEGGESGPGTSAPAADGNTSEGGESGPGASAPAADGETTEPASAEGESAEAQDPAADGTTTDGANSAPAEGASDQEPDSEEDEEEEEEEDEDDFFED